MYCSALVISSLSYLLLLLFFVFRKSAPLGVVLHQLLVFLDDVKGLDKGVGTERGGNGVGTERGGNGVGTERGGNGVGERVGDRMD